MENDFLLSTHTIRGLRFANLIFESRIIGLVCSIKAKRLFKVYIKFYFKAENGF